MTIISRIYLKIREQGGWRSLALLIFLTALTLTVTFPIRYLVMQYARILAQFKHCLPNVMYRMQQIFEKSLISNFMKICPVGAKLFHADIRSDGQKDVMKLVVAFQNFYKTPEKLSFILFWGGGAVQVTCDRKLPRVADILSGAISSPRAAGCSSLPYMKTHAHLRGS
jgi:hypothetical protein